jgi:hypothetical protein
MSSMIQQSIWKKTCKQMSDDGKVISLTPTQSTEIDRNLADKLAKIRAEQILKEKVSIKYCLERGI